MEKYFDIHNHLFNKDFLAKELLYRLMKELKKLIHPENDDERERGIKDRFVKIKEVIQALKRFRYALKVFKKKNSTAIYEELNKTYKGEFILTPLTFDLTFCFTSSPNRDENSDNDPLKDVFEKEMEKMFGEIEDRTRSLSRDFNSDSTSEEDQLWNNYLKEKEEFLAAAQELNVQHETDTGKTRGLFGKHLPGKYDGFEEQIKQLEELKNHPEYKDMVFPFLAVDPRRDGILEYAKANVGKGKLFIGVKLYCPNGYSPTDPLLYGPEGERGGIYAFCEDNGIPITTHNSDGGFATFSKKVLIDGDIHVNGNLVRINKEKIAFKTSILGKDAVYERAVTLNHPLLWRKVIEKYPNLILNLAHFGGGQQLEGAIDHRDKQELWANQIIALVKDPRYKVHTDLSCFSEPDILKKFVASPVYQEIKHRVLYGSDFILLLLFENDFTDNVTQFKKIFGSDFDVIARDNPKEFLKHVL
ncbi:amidohydrolase family protein [Prolixibacteraceae bacterium Z1-6]|uniref:Amidohydrolase family protein n=1 Tax=Draconibacterium aestuarii TaxID=2998507 RepID=A0A9X3F9P9_9BACT|nr:amidohydrolase family protein [Prolixibacteraceae bacterium Z1-6]